MAREMAAPVAGFQEPRQERSRRTLARIADATEALLLERGPGEVTVQNVVTRADTSVGAFYTRFRSKDDAVAYVHGRFWDDVRHRWSGFLAPEGWTGVPAGLVIAEVVRRYARVFLADEGRGRAFFLELLGRRDGALLERVRALDGEIAAAMGRLLHQRGDEIEHGRPREAAEEGFRRVLSAVRDHVLFGGDRWAGPDPDRSPGGRGATGSEAGARRLILSLTQMYGGMLGIRERPGSWGELLRMCSAARRIRHHRSGPEMGGA